jgi:transposase
MQKTPACIRLSAADRATLDGLVSGRNTPQKVVWRSRIVLLLADRLGVMAVARSVGMSKVTVSRWQERYLAKAIPGLRRDGTRPGRKPPLTGEPIKQVVDKTLHEKPAAGTHWTSRKMAAACGLSYTSVQRIWKAHELKPHLVKTFKLSNDKQFAEKVRDIVGQLDIRITPSSGRSISRIRKIEPPIANEQIRNAATTVRFRGAFVRNGQKLR